MQPQHDYLIGRQVPETDELEVQTPGARTDGGQIMTGGTQSNNYFSPQSYNEVSMHHLGAGQYQSDSAANRTDEQFYSGGP